jgi:hypothetical protein
LARQYVMAMDSKPQRESSRNNAPAASVECGDFIDQTIAIWQPRTKRQLTREDGREIIENMTGFFRILQEWDRVDRTKKDADKS